MSLRGGQMEASTIQRVRLRDMVILLPGITGSVLQRGGTDVWGASGAAVRGFLTTHGGSLRDLRLLGDSGADEADDGVRATRLVDDVSLIPGLVKIDGYSGIRRMVQRSFAVTLLRSADGEVRNYYEFPYDWRRDNRISARLFGRFVSERLARWREASGADDAKAIILAHSMGGLVARYYLEVLGGWRECAGLITFGTPYRGSVAALDYLANGYREFLVDLTSMVRSCPSVYQLLPIYEVLLAGGRHQRIAEADDIPQVSKELAVDALAFHREIERAVNANRRDELYAASGYGVLPVIGTDQPTLQSALNDDGHIRATIDVPPWIGEAPADGDGTVPRISAIPIEFTGGFRAVYVCERHSSLQNNPFVLQQIRESIRQRQIAGLSAIRGPGWHSEPPGRPGICLELQDLYLPGEPVEMRASIQGAEADCIQLRAHIESTASTQPGGVYELQRLSDRTWHLLVAGLPAGDYRVQVTADGGTARLPQPVSDIFAVA